MQSLEIGTRSWEIGACVPMSLAPICLARVSYDPDLPTCGRDGLSVS